MSRQNEPALASGHGTTSRNVLGLLALSLAAATTTLGLRLVAERDRGVALQQRIDRLEAENVALMAQYQRGAGSGRVGSDVGTRSPGTAPAGASLDPLARPRPVPPPASAIDPADGVDRDPTPPPSAAPRSRALERANALQDPSARAAMRRQQSAAMHRMYPDLAESLGIGREGADRFIDVLVEQQMRKVDATARLAASDDSRNADEMRLAGQRLAAANRTMDQELSAQFGDDVLQAWKTYQQGQGARMELRDLQLELADAGMALTSAQRESLVAAMVREQGSGTKVLSGDARVQQAEASYRRMQSAARAVLSAEQFARFDARQRQRLEALSAAGAGGSASP